MHRVQRLRARSQGGTCLPLCVKLKGAVACGKPLDGSVSNGHLESQAITEISDLSSSDSSPEQPQPSSSLAPNTGTVELCLLHTCNTLNYGFTHDHCLLIFCGKQWYLQMPKNRLHRSYWYGTYFWLHSQRFKSIGCAVFLLSLAYASSALTLKFKINQAP